VDLLTVGQAAAQGVAALDAAAGEDGGGLVINVFWIIVAAANFLFFLWILYSLAFKPLGNVLGERRRRIEEGLRDAEQARRDRESAEQERLVALQEARREANEIINRAQKVAAETREADIAATREELSRMRERATAEIEAEKHKAIGELRAEVTDLALAAAERVVGDSMNGARQRELVAEFLRESGSATAAATPPDGGGRSS
jgi:F-type H+-transporting ATPase subunit b